jgi:hypothetical protein
VKDSYQLGKRTAEDWLASAGHEQAFLVSVADIDCFVVLEGSRKLSCEGETGSIGAFAFSGLHHKLRFGRIPDLLSVQRGGHQFDCALHLFCLFPFPIAIARPVPTPLNGI